MPQTCLKQENEAALGCLELTPFIHRISAQVVRLIEIAYPLDKSLFTDGKKIERLHVFSPGLFRADKQTSYIAVSLFET